MRNIKRDRGVNIVENINIDGGTLVIELEITFKSLS